MTPSRRELLAAFLGAPALLAGCSPRVPPLPAGELVGPSVDLGHRLRDGWRPKPAGDAWETVPVVIVGGGDAGLAAAWPVRAGRGGVPAPDRVRGGGPRRDRPGRGAVGRLAGPPRLHIAAAPLAGRLRLPRRLRRDPGPRERVGRPVLLRRPAEGARRRR